MSDAITSESILKEISTMLIDIVGEEYLGDIDIEMNTSFEADLDLESIDMVVLIERLYKKYGDKLKFEEWFRELEQSEVTELSVGDLVEFIVECLSQPEVA